jgi:hypothetical protein
MPDGAFSSMMDRHGFIPINHETPKWFPVSAGEVFDANGSPIAGYQRIWREDSGDTIALHTSDYHLVPYQENFSRFDNAIMRSGLDTTDMRVATDMSHNGGRVFRQYLFPAHTKDVGQGDPVALRIIMFDSYDGSYSFRGTAGFFRFVCANTCVIGDTAIDVRAKHTSNFGERSSRLIEAVVKAADSFNGYVENMRHWSTVRLSLGNARELLNLMPQGNDSLRDTLFADYATKHGENGTAWDLYNVLTSWATHSNARANRAQVRAQREDRVLALTNKAAWKELCNA